MEGHIQRNIDLEWIALLEYRDCSATKAPAVYEVM